MGYSIIDTDTGEHAKLCFTSRYIETAGLENTDAIYFTPDWTCDPCNLPDRRFRIEAHGCVTFYPWYEVIIPAIDDDRAIRCKVEHWQKVDAARDALRAAEKTLYNLTH